MACLHACGGQRKYALCLLIGTFLALLNNVESATHWIVTEHGRIQSSQESAFVLRRPYDLAAVFQQMERANEMQNVRDHLRELQPKDGARLDEGDIWSLQKEVMESDDNCKAAGKPVYEFDFFTSTVLPLSHFGLKLEDHINVHSVLDLAATSFSPSKGGSLSVKTAPTNPYQEPKCWVFKMDFSMHSLEHLESIRNRHKMASGAETALRSVVVPTGLTIDQFGHSIQQALKKSPESWVAYSMASFFWRMKGNASAAVECIRRALHYAPHKYKAEPLLNLGNVLHRNGQSDDAAIAMQWALDSSPRLSVLHFTLANILASLERDKEAAYHYEASLQLQPRLVASAQLRLHAVRCRQALVSALNRQAKEWESALGVLRSKQARLMALQKTISKMRDEQSPEDFTTLQEIIYRKWLESERKIGNLQYCDRSNDELTKLKCPDKFLPEDHLPLWADRFEAKLGIGNYKDSVKPSNPSKAGQNDQSQKRTVDKCQWLYKNWADRSHPMYFEKFDWPPESKCKNVRIPKWTDYDPVMVPPINKGFNISLMSSFSRIKGADKPVCGGTWDDGNEPYRGAFPTSNWLIERFLSSEELDETESISPASVEPSLQSQFLSAMGCGPPCVNAAGGQSVIQSLVKRAGHRLASEMEKAAEFDKKWDEPSGEGFPLWFLETLAISYWHSQGQLGQAVQCARAAISKVPLRYRDMPLTALSGLLYRLSAVEEATEAVAEALAAAPYDPEPNYFMGCMLAVKGDLNSAMTHFAKALRQNSSFRLVEQHLLPLACYQRFKVVERLAQCERHGCHDSQVRAENPPNFDFLDGKMTLMESRTNSGRVMDYFVRTTTAKPEINDEIESDDNDEQMQRHFVDNSHGSRKEMLVEYSDFSVPYARLSVGSDLKLTADPDLLTVPVNVEDEEACLVFANGSLSESCRSNANFSPFLVSIKNLAKSIAETLQPKVYWRKLTDTLLCGAQKCGQRVEDHFEYSIPAGEFPRNPASVSKFIAAIAKNLFNKTSETKAEFNDPFYMSVPQQLLDGDDLENRLRLLLALGKSTSKTSTTSISSCSTDELFSTQIVSPTSNELPDPLTIVNEGKIDSILNMLNPECHMPGVILASSSVTRSKGSNSRGSSFLAEPFCECSPPYRKPPIVHQTSSKNSHQNSSDYASPFFDFASLSDLHYTPERHLQPWAAQLQTSLKLDSSQQLAAILASHLHHSSRANACSDDANGWLPLTLAARYWRLQGNAAEATRCLSAAVASSSPLSRPRRIQRVVAAVPLLELSDFLRHLGYLPHSLVAAASTLVFPNQLAASVAASRLGVALGRLERYDAAVLFYELAASAAAAFAAASKKTDPILEMEATVFSDQMLQEQYQKQNQPEETKYAFNNFEQESILRRLHATTCQRDRRYRRAAMLLRRLIRSSPTSHM